MTKLGSKLPADQSQSSKNYDFQHAEALRSSLRMLEKSGFNKVFCEWHDDFVEVVGQGEDETYIFCQVKTKKLGVSGFNYSAMFGLAYSSEVKKTSKKKSQISLDGILHKQFKLYIDFKDCSKTFRVLSNNEFAEDVYKMLQFAHGKHQNDIVLKYNYEKLVGAYIDSVEEDINELDVNSFLKKVELLPECNLLNDIRPRLVSELTKKLEVIKEVPFRSNQIEMMVEDVLRFIKLKSDNQP